jgi:zinc/manganese transport system permease protein
MSIADIVPPSWDLVADFQLLFEFHSMQNAYLAGTLVAIAAGVMGYFMVLRGQSFAGHSLANVGFAGATGAVLFGIPSLVGVFIAGVLAAMSIHVFNVSEHRNQQSDIAVGAIFTASLALGYLFIHLATDTYANNVYNILFGNVLGISDGEVGIMLATTLILLGIFAIIGRPLLFASIDPDVAAARGVPVRMLSLTFFVLLAVVVAIAVQIIGVLLIFALLVTPGAIAQQMTARPFLALLMAVLLSESFVWLGLAVGYFTPYPVGFFITSFAFGMYLIVRIVRLLLHRMQRRVPAAKQGEVA